MSSLNQCSFIGNLGRDPEVRTTNDGSKVVNLSLAVSENWKDRNTGERKEKTEWIRIVIFNEHIAKVAEAYLHKGSKIFVQGQMTTRKWTDQSGAEKYSTEIVLNKFKGELTMLDGPKGEKQDSYDPGPARGYGGQGGQGPDPRDLDDSIPFITNGGMR